MKVDLIVQYLVQVEQLEQEVAELRQTLADKKEGENAMLQVSIFFSLFIVTYSWMKALDLFSGIPNYNDFVLGFDES